MDKQKKLVANVDNARKWRVRNTKAKDGAGELKGYDIEVPQLAGRDKHSSGDIWVTVYRGDGVLQGEGVGAAACSDEELETVYAVGSLNVIDGSDIVLWVCVRAHHEPRIASERAAGFLDSAGQVPPWDGLLAGRYWAVLLGWNENERVSICKVPFHIYPGESKFWRWYEGVFTRAWLRWFGGPNPEVPQSP